MPQTITAFISGAGAIRRIFGRPLDFGIEGVNPDELDFISVTGRTPQTDMPFSIGNLIGGALRGIGQFAEGIGQIRQDVGIITGNPVAPPAVVPTSPVRQGGFIPGPSERPEPFPFGTSLIPSAARNVGLPAVVGGAILGGLVPIPTFGFGNELPGLQLPDPFDQGLPTTFAGKRPTKAQIRAFLLKEAGVSYRGFRSVVRDLGAERGGACLGLECSAVAFLLGNAPRSRGRGITGPQIRNLGRTLTKLQSINRKVAAQCRRVAPARRSSAKKPC